jgi:hypothetical protein
MKTLCEFFTTALLIISINSFGQNLTSSNPTNEGGAVELINPLKTANNIANKWIFYNMTGQYGNSLQFWNYGSNGFYGSRFTILDNGNVGIGATSPVSKLDVRGDLYLNSGNDDNHVYWADHNMTMGTRPGDYAHNVFSLKPGGASQGKLFSVFSMYNANSSTSFESKIQLHTDGPSFLNGGNVGIGSTNPDSKLTVKGKIHAEEVKIDLAVPADYVFEKYYLGQSSLKPDYTLLTLSEVEKYTQANHHLPNVPSAKEIKENGLLLGEMSNVLLQKIEELTLYVIEQNKSIEGLKEQLKVQNAKTEKLETAKK